MENMGMTSPPVEVPDEASLVRLAWNQELKSFKVGYTEGTLPLTLVPKVIVDGSSLLVIPIVCLFPPWLMTMREELM